MSDESKRTKKKVNSSHRRRNKAQGSDVMIMNVKGKGGKRESLQSDFSAWQQ